MPLQEENGPAHNYKTAVDDYVNSNGISAEGTACFNGDKNNYFNGNVGIGTRNPSAKLAVNGNIRAKGIRVESNNWPDYVFSSGYDLTPLQQLDHYTQRAWSFT